MHTNDVDNYLGRLPDDLHATVDELRQNIKAASPEITELISYGIPSFKYKRRQFMAIAAYSTHCNFIVMSYPIMKAFKRDLKNFETDKATIRFTNDKPLPKALVKKLVKVRMAEIDALLTQKKKSK